MNFIKDHVGKTTNAQRQAADRVNKAETNYMGVEIPKKNVVKLHEAFPSDKLPATPYLKEWAYEFIREHGRKPETITRPFASAVRWICFYLEAYPGADKVIRLNVIPGEFLELR